MKRLEDKTKKGELIKKQLSTWKKDRHKHISYYIINIFSILINREPSYISPNNKVVDSRIYRVDF